MLTKGRQGQRPNDRWETFIVRLTADNPRWAKRKIWENLPIENAKLEPDYRIHDEPPSRRTVDRRVEELRRPENKAILDARRSVYFPETFLANELPWEAAPVIMELVRVYPSLDRIDGSARPSIRQAKWFYWIRINAPDAPLDIIINLAGLGAVSDAMTNRGTWVNRVIEAYIYYEPWQKIEDHLDKDRVSMCMHLFSDYVMSLPVDVGDDTPSEKVLWEAGITPTQYLEMLPTMEEYPISLPKLLVDKLGG